MKCIASLKAEQNQRALNTISKTPLTSYRTDSHKKYGKLLTPFAYSHMKKELDKADQAEVFRLEDGSVQVKIGQAETGLVANSCTCKFFISIKLPCRHILASKNQKKRVTEEKENSISTQITMPPRMLKRGRPKGAGLTVIGLPKKRKTTSAIPFLKKSPTEKERGKWKALMYM